VELALDDDERALLLGALFDQARLRFTAEQLTFYELAYLAFRTGHAALAAQSLATCAPAEARRMEAARARYLRLAQTRLALQAP
jgi:hypothetical protein